MGLVISWLTERKHSTYGLALTRIIVGFIVASQLIVNWSDRHYTWGDGARWSDEVSDDKTWPVVLSSFRHAEGLGFDLLYLCTIGVAIAMMVGFSTRAAVVSTLFLYMSLYVSNPFVGSGGDAVLRMVLLYMCFADAGRRWSVDARRSHRTPEVSGETNWFSVTLHNLAVVLIVHQVVMVYVASALWKVQSEAWMDGTAVYYPLQTEAYSPWHDLLQPIFASGPIIAAATWTAIIVQLFFPVLLIYRPTRMAALIMITGMHLCIGIFMGILYFSLVMIAVDMILVSDATWRRISSRIAGVRLATNRQFIG